jgi:hypothetical protein
VPAAGPLPRLWFTLGVTILLIVAASVPPAPGLSGPAQLLLWIAGAAALVAAFRSYDRRVLSWPPPALFDRQDWLWMAALFAAGAALRIHGLAVEPPGLAYDEILPIIDTLRLGTYPTYPAFGTYGIGVHGTFHYTTLPFMRYAGWLGLDAIQGAKLPVALCGALSISALYAAARLLGARSGAAAAAIFLLAQGWHWVLSRFYYRYGCDLALISLTTALLLGGLASRRLALFSAAGVTTAIGILWISVATLLPVWGIVIFADAAGARVRGIRQLVLPAAVWALVLVVCLAPFFVQLRVQPTALGRIQALAIERQKLLEQMKITSAEAYLRALQRIPFELYKQERYDTREALRPGKPALDPVLSAASIVGAIWCLVQFHRSRAARLCLLGLLLFVVPALRSYPADGVDPIPRRMIGSILFLAWMASFGPQALLSWVLPRRIVGAALLVAAIASMALNLSYIRNVYIPLRWYGEYGVERVHVMRGTWQAAEDGPVLLRTSPNLRLGVDLPRDAFFISYGEVADPNQLRRKLAEQADRPHSLILPSHTKFDRDENERWIAALADVVPPSAWRSGPADPGGSPMYRVVRIPAAADVQARILPSR